MLYSGYYIKNKSHPLIICPVLLASPQTVPSSDFFSSAMMSYTFRFWFSFPWPNTSSSLPIFPSSLETSLAVQVDL